MAKRRRRRSKKYRKLRNALRIAFALLVVAAIITGIVLLVSGIINKDKEPAPEGEKVGFIGRLFGKDDETADPPVDGLQAEQTGEQTGEQPEEQPEEEKKGFFARLFGKKDNGGSIFSQEEPDPTPVPEPTPTPLPEFNPYAVSGTSPADFGLETAVEVDGSVMDASAYVATETIDFGEGYEYTDVEGVISFRGNNFRDSSAYGTVSMTAKKFSTTPWTFTIGSMSKMSGSGSWTGCGWTGQPLIVRWPESTKKIMNMYDWAKAKEGLVEVIYATLDGRIYFLDLESGQQTRESISLGFPFKGAGALDPRGYPIMYLGSGDDSPSQGKDSSHAFIISLVDGSVMYEFGLQDSFRLRELSYFDSSALVDAETDTLIYPGENGILYLIKLNTQYDEAAGTLSINPGRVVKWRYKGAKNNTTAVDGSNGWWLGFEDSAIVWRGHVILTENGGHMICLDLNTLQVKWVQDTLDDTNCTGVLALEGETNHPYVYTSTSFHPGWRKPGNQTAPIPIWKIDAVTGEKVWTNNDYNCQTIAEPNQVSGGVQGSLVSGRGSLSNYVLAPIAMTEGMKGEVVAFNRNDGTVAWKYQFQGYPWSSPVAVYDENGTGYVIQCTKSGYIHLFDDKGNLLDEMNLGSNIEASPAVFDNTIVVGTRGGLIYGIKLT
ncbi:MAG: PQQ-binding-like beta-propeller repeat protein [Clostridia bacterium]|nr:PQQ-binding-like beta-propeller repeat protein [Clostridia bacterium]